MLTFHSNILIIDDNESLLEMLSVSLKRHAFRVAVRKKIEILENDIIETDPDLILLDKNLGSTSGVAICKSIKSHPHFSAIPVVMLSAYTLPAEEWREAGANAFIAKPFDMNNLLTTIKTLLVNSAE